MTAAAAAAVSFLSAALPPLPSSHRRACKAASLSLVCSSLPRSTKLPRLVIGIHDGVSRLSHCSYAVPARLQVFSNYEVSPRLSGSSISTNQSEFEENVVSIKLPRRNLLVQFTCNTCGERTERTINRTAYERGTVFVQCSGCLQHHKLVDNLGLIVEYDFREDMD